MHLNAKDVEEKRSRRHKKPDGNNRRGRKDRKTSNIWVASKDGLFPKLLIIVEIPELLIIVENPELLIIVEFLNY